jgi:maltooligosyltrehalose trehalohydrolase
MRVGADYFENGRCCFVVWAPFPEKVELKIISPDEKIIPMEKFGRGYWKVELDNISPDTLYFYRLNGDIDRPDPASFFQPLGVHGPSQVVDSNFSWEDGSWKDIDIDHIIIYEMHVGTFTPEGTFEAIIPRLKDLKELGINAIQLMPLAQFPGERNWGYDGVYLFAPQNSYGGPQGLKILVNECHKNGLAVIIDVVYNHFGPEGNYMSNFGPYLTSKHTSPWGQCVNFDDTYSTDVRNFFIENMLHWFRDFHIDGLRLDAVHAMFDISAKHILQELAEKAEEYSKQKDRKFYLIAESDLNDIKITRSRDMGGYGIDAQWSDDFTHSLRSLLTGESQAYYMDFGRVEHLAKAYKEGFVCTDSYSNYRKRNHGNSSISVPANHFVVFLQNHDQVGNRMVGERLTDLMGFDSFKLAAAAVFLSPFIPLIFMGEEYWEDSPYMYFVHHSDEELIENVRKGRKEDFKAFKWDGEPPDPQHEDTFIKSKLSWYKRNEGKHNIMLNLYKTLISLRKEIPALCKLEKKRVEVKNFEFHKVLYLKRWGEDEDNCTVFALFNFNENDVHLDLDYLIDSGKWAKVIDSDDEKWAGKGSLLPQVIEPGQNIMMRKHSFVLYKQEIL